MESHDSFFKYKVLKVFLGVFSVMEIVVPSLRSVEEEVRMFIVELDLLLLFWVPVLNIAAQWLKKRKLPDWFLPTPVCVWLLAQVICAVAGTGRTLGGYPGIIRYALCNGTVLTFIAVFCYDAYVGLRDTLWSSLREAVARIKKRKEEKE